MEPNGWLKLQMYFCLKRTIDIMNATTAALSQTVLKIHAAISRRHLFLLVTSPRLKQIVQYHICFLTPDLILFCKQNTPVDNVQKKKELLK